MKKKSENWLHLIISGFLLLAMGGLAGYAGGFFRATLQEFPEIQMAADTNEGVSTIQLTGIEQGELRGQLTGRKTRIAYDKNSILILEPGDAFSIPLSGGNFASSASPLNASPDTPFVASKRGKYYYSVSDSRAGELSLQNRIYFKSREEAERKGFQPR